MLCNYTFFLFINSLRMATSTSKNLQDVLRISSTDMKPNTLPYQKYSYTTKYPCSESTKYPVGSKDGH